MRHYTFFELTTTSAFDNPDIVSNLNQIGEVVEKLFVEMNPSFLIFTLI